MDTRHYGVERIENIRRHRSFLIKRLTNIMFKLAKWKFGKYSIYVTAPCNCVIAKQTPKMK